MRLTQNDHGNVLSHTLGVFLVFFLDYSIVVLLYIFDSILAGNVYYKIISFSIDYRENDGLTLLRTRLCLLQGKFSERSQQVEATKQQIIRLVVAMSN